MRVLKLPDKYETRIWLNDENKIILKIDCSCWNFVNRRIKKVGKVHAIKYYATPCKHLSPWVNVLEKQGYTLKIPTIEGADKLTSKIRKQVLRVWGDVCFFPNCSETNNLHIHRMIAGAYGGKYCMINCRPYCIKHHKLIHQGEFR